MNQYASFHTETQEETDSMLAAFQKKGFKVYSAQTRGYRNFCFTNPPDTIQGTSPSSPVVCWRKFLKDLKGYKQPINVEINNEYTAVVYPDCIKVGCQIISFDVVKRLTKAIAKMKKVAKSK
jgi:hypothetical protein